MSMKEELTMDIEHRKQWEKTVLRRFVITLNRNRDEEMINYLESIPNVRQYLKNLIRKEMNEQTPESDKSEI